METDTDLFCDEDYKRATKELIRKAIKAGDDLAFLDDGSIVVTRTIPKNTIYFFNKNVKKFYCRDVGKEFYIKRL